ncbi:hypothetical protein EON65_30890 [archaeon]|nr:MAG: hypothetical protein EON65_30890 [archaeon]
MIVRGIGQIVLVSLPNFNDKRAYKLLAYYINKNRCFPTVTELELSWRIFEKDFASAVDYFPYIRKVLEIFPNAKINMELNGVHFDSEFFAYFNSLHSAGLNDKLDSIYVIADVIVILGLSMFCMVMFNLQWNSFSCMIVNVGVYASPPSRRP